jgi:hypothetical protein
MGYAFYGILQGMGKVIHGINAPFIPRVVVSFMQDAENNRISHIDVGAGHIDFSP